MGNLGSLLITGGTGFLGSHLIERLLELNYAVIVAKRQNSSLDRIKHVVNRIEFVDLEHDIDVLQVFQERSIFGVIHLATDYGRDSALSQVVMTNVIMPLKIIEYAKTYGTKIFINTDTFIAKENSTYNYLNSYSKTKYILKDLLVSFSKEIKVANMKLEHIFGENDADTKFVTSILKDLINNVPNIDLTAGTQKRDFIYVADVVKAFITIIQNHEVLGDFCEFEVGVGESLSVKDFVIKMRLLSHSQSNLNFGKLPMREGEFAESKANNSSLKELGWNTDYDIDSGLSRLINSEKTKLNKTK